MQLLQLPLEGWPQQAVSMTLPVEFWLLVGNCYLYIVFIFLSVACCSFVRFASVPLVEDVIISLDNFIFNYLWVFVVLRDYGNLNCFGITVGSLSS